jgi:exonuclease SbcC
VELEKQISVLERDLHHVKSNLDSLNLELKEKNETLKKLRSEKDSFRQQRVSLFAEKDPDKEEEARTEAVEDAGRQMESRREAREAALREMSAMRSRLEDLGRSIHIRSDDLQKAEISFGRRLIADDFKNEDAYLASCLSEPERKALQDRAQALDVERAELDARRSDRKFGLEELRRENRTDAPLDAARDRRDQLAAELKETQRAIGELRLRLKDEEDFSQRKRERLAVIDRRRRECARWDKLHELIGSADGQKFRNFAQSLTFEMVIHHANEYLQRMMDRYHLVPNEDRPLELRVIDGYQAGEIRSTQNLSGGETFIVSLALALGLSQMASRKVRMDSLFLDEGFGSLDEEALDSALSTLAALRREGKTIGVISHVEALKERIGVQIEVIPQGDGQSVIRAPGCVGTPE